jgi:hypothetical protein
VGGDVGGADVDVLEVEVIVDSDGNDAAAAMVNVTGMSCPLFVAPTPKTVMVAE